MKNDIIHKMICDRIKEVRVKNNVSQVEISERLSIKQSSYSKLESGKSPITIEKLYAITDALGIPLEYFFQSDVKSIIDKSIELTNALFLSNAENNFKIALPDFPEERDEAPVEKEKTKEPYAAKLPFLLQRLQIEYQYKQLERLKLVLKEALQDTETQRRLYTKFGSDLAELELLYFLK